MPLAAFFKMSYPIIRYGIKNRAKRMPPLKGSADNTAMITEAAIILTRTFFCFLFIEIPFLYQKKIPQSSSTMSKENFTVVFYPFAVF